ncbi:hypothetical protein DH2020_028826 [Rehmannia glutinosa]|uniref:Uncharacterized protein n=1 Tax=Rehmannia glutinosa TaxID=99300 RepID=A0ABR0VRC2_REHGL
MELDFDKYCILDGSPTTVLPAPRRRSKVADRKSNGKLKCGNDMLRLKENFTEISFNRTVVRPVETFDPVEPIRKRQSGAQSINAPKISDEDSSLAERNRSSVMSTSEQSTSSFSEKQIKLHSRDSINYSFSGKSEKRSSINQSVQDLMITSEPTVNLQKSLSAKLALPHSPAHLESNGSKSSTPRAIFNPVRKKHDPFVKSRSHRSPFMSCANEIGSEINDNIDLSCNETMCKLPAKDFSDNLNSVPLSSPAHLHGVLKLENKNGVPFFEFAVKSPEDVFVAKTWKVDNALNWVYTFHSLHHKRKSNASGWGFKDNNKESTMVGQMVISCYLCTELKGAGAFNDSMVTEYVLYDITQSRRSFSSQDNSSCSPDVSDETKNKVQFKQSRESGHFESQPLAVAELHPELETAAIVMQVPFEKRESLKFESGDSKMDSPLLPNLLDLCRLEQAKEGISDNSSRGKMHVVIPAGNHSLPSSESRGPSPLLDRWRLGGGCDCGGWDMACPLDVFGNPNFRVAECQPLMDNQHPVELFVQGRKDNIPAFAMRPIEDGKYAIDFHAQLSSLQAFSICVSILHATEASTAVGQERSKQMLQSDSLRVFAKRRSRI